MTFMLYAQYFIQSDLHWISRHTSTFFSVLVFSGNRTHDHCVASANALLFELQESFNSLQVVLFYCYLGTAVDKGLTKVLP